MALLANITVKKFDGTTDITYTGIDPAGGDVPALWRSQTVGNAQAHQPDLRVSSKKRGSLVDMKATYRYPQIATNSTTGVTSVQRYLSGSLSATYDMGMATADVNEAVAQFLNLCASALLKEMFRTGTSAN